MSEPVLSEIRLAAFNFAPKGWAACDGQILPINQNQALFALLGTTYGGNGQTTFALPDLRDRVPLHFGNGFSLGQRGGEVAHTVTQNEMPQHTHVYNGVTEAADLTVPGGNRLATADPTTFGDAYGPPGNLVAMAPEVISPVGGSQAHDNLQPYLTVMFIIALQGIFPSQN